MANKDWPKGMVPAGTLGGGKDGPQSGPYECDTTEVMGLFTPIVFAAGKIKTATEGSAGHVDGTITQILVPDEDGTLVAKDNGSTAAYHAAAATDAWAMIQLATSDQLFEMQADDGGTALTKNAVGKNIDMLAASNVVDTVTGQSTAELDQSSVDTTATLQFRIVDIRKRPDNDWGGNTDIIVQPNQTNRDLNVAGT